MQKQSGSEKKKLKTNLRIFKLKKYSHVKQANYMKNRNFTKLATPPLTPTKNLSLQTRHTCTTLRKTGDCSAAIYAWDNEAIWLLPSQLQLLETTDQFKQFLVLTTIILVGVFFLGLFSTLHCWLFFVVVLRFLAFLDVLKWQICNAKSRERAREAKKSLHGEEGRKNVSRC